MERMYLILLLASIPASEGTNPFVKLTTEGRINLVGAHCPGTTRLYCEGTDLSSLRWTFNGDTEIDTFIANDMIITRPPRQQHPPFILVELTAVAQSSNVVFSNFSSILTVDLLQLGEESVTNITCGDPGTNQTLPVNVVIIRDTVPVNPNITEVNATYNSAGLRSVTVTWNKLPTDCPVYGSSLTYIVNLTGSDPVVVNHISCGAFSCSATFEVLSSENIAEYELTLSATNDIGSSDLVRYPTIIGSQSGQYITPVLNPSNCITTGSIPALSIGEAVGISVSLSSIVSIIIGLVVGVMITYCVMHRQINRGNNEQTPSPPQQPPPLQPQKTSPAGPVYEEVSQPRGEIELKTNQAYGPVRH